MTIAKKLEEMDSLLREVYFLNKTKRLDQLRLEIYEQLKWRSKDSALKMLTERIMNAYNGNPNTKQKRMKIQAQRDIAVYLRCEQSHARSQLDMDLICVRGVNIYKKLRPFRDLILSDELTPKIADLNAKILKME